MRMSSHHSRSIPRLMTACLMLALLGLAFGVGSGCESRGLCKSDQDCAGDSVCVGGLCGDKLLCAQGKVCESTNAPTPTQTATCTAGEKRCDGNLLKICRADGSTWAELDCGQFHLCQGGACVRKPVSATCGNGTLDKDEQCDDGNTSSGDGCSRYCLKEAVERWEAPNTIRAPEPLILGSRRCRNVQTRNTFRNNKTTLYIKISPVICRSNRRPIVSTAKVNAHIAFLNKVYRSANFVFLRGETRWEDDADNCEVFYNTESSATLSRYTKKDAISVFYARNILGGSFSIGGFANHSGVVLNATAFKAEEILAHELGHSFGLDHPHACYHGKETKENCETAGDQLCDTPVDPGPSRVKGLDVCPDRSVKNGACKVTSCSKVECPGGEKPLIDNLMSYYHCGTALTADQLAALRCVAFHEQANRVSTRRPCSADAECGNAKCKDGYCESSTPGCTKHDDCGQGLRCNAGQCVACVQDRDAAANDGLCCSSERNGKGLCCTKEACCGPQNHSSFTSNGQCRCDAGYTWTDPVASGDFRCKPREQPSCLLDGMWSSTDAQCCNKERDDQGKCCKGAGCCAPRNHSYTGNDGRCQCQHGYEREAPNDTNNHRCKKSAPPPCKKDGEAASSDDQCCSKERSDAGKCCTGNGCCGPQNNSATTSDGSCKCNDGFVRTTPNDPGDLRCKRPPAPSCKNDGEAASSDDQCCSKERNDVGKCCTGKECCASRNNSFTASNGRCQCNEGYEWEAPNATNDYRCKKKLPPPCKKDGEAAADAASCCSKSRDDGGKCCSGNGCCLASANAEIAADGTCRCKAGFVRVTPSDPSDVRCKQKPSTPGGFSCTFVRSLSGHSNLLRAVAVSPDGSKILTGSYDKTIKLWETSTGKLIRTYTGHNRAIMSLDFRPDGSEFASGDFGGVYRRWSLSSGSFKSSLTMSYPLRATIYSPDGKVVAAGTQRGISLWTVGGSGFSFAASSFVRGIAYRPDGQRFAVALEDKTIAVYTASNRRKVLTLKGHTARVFDVSYNSDGTRLASGSIYLKIWDATNGTLLRTLNSHSGATFNVLFHPKNPNIVFSGGDDDNVQIWDVSKGQVLQTLTGHTDDVYTLGISPDGKTLVSGAGDKTARIWRCQ